MGCQVGYWKVNGEIFAYKPSALLKATEIGAEVTYHYYDEIWDSVDRSQLGKVPLRSLYRERARQLRDSYDYLILYYSGGADSRNILNTFIDNNIKLDCVFVKWPVSAVGKNIYPVVANPDSINFMCEWDLVIKPDLDRLRSKHPDIRIEIVDWLEGASMRSFTDCAFDDLQHFTYMSNMLRVPCHSLVEREMVDRGFKVASIYGVDKPYIKMDRRGKVYMIFTDSATTVNPPRAHNPNGTEYFYWTPDMPLLAFEQAYQLMRWFENQPRYQHLISIWSQDPSVAHLTDVDKHKMAMRKLDIVNGVLYPNHDPTVFQADKPLRQPGSYIGVPKDFYLETHPEIAEIKVAWEYHWRSWVGQIDARFMTTWGYFNVLGTKPFYLGTIKTS